MRAGNRKTSFATCVWISHSINRYIYYVEAADPARLVVNPECKRLQKEADSAKRQLQKLNQQYVTRSVTRRRVSKNALTMAELRTSIKDTEQRIEALKAQIKARPEKVPVGDLKDASDIVRF